MLSRIVNMSEDIVFDSLVGLIVDAVTSSTGTLVPSIIPNISNPEAVYEEFDVTNFNPTLVAGLSDNIDAVDVALAFDACDSQKALDLAVSRRAIYSVVRILARSDAHPTLDHILTAIESGTEMLSVLLEDSRVSEEVIEKALLYAVDLDDPEAVSILLRTDKVSADNKSAAVLQAADINASQETMQVLIDNLFVRDYILAETLALMTEGKNNNYNTVLYYVYERFDSLDYVEEEVI